MSKATEQPKSPEPESKVLKEKMTQHLGGTLGKGKVNSPQKQWKTGGSAWKLVVGGNTSQVSGEKQKQKQTVYPKFYPQKIHPSQLKTGKIHEI